MQHMVCCIPFSVTSNCTWLFVICWKLLAQLWKVSTAMVVRVPWFLIFSSGPNWSENLTNFWSWCGPKVWKISSGAENFLHTAQPGPRTNWLWCVDPWYIVLYSWAPLYFPIQKLWKEPIYIFYSKLCLLFTSQL